MPASSTPGGSVERGDRLIPEEVTLVDVRADMPNHEVYSDWQRAGDVTGIAIHHSATAHPILGFSRDDAGSMFKFHVNVRGWAHGGYNYVILPNGVIQYALDEAIAAYHAGVQDPEWRQILEDGQYWNDHYLAVCLPGWFSRARRARIFNRRRLPMLNLFTRPTKAQYASLIILARNLMSKYGIPVQNVRGHRELDGCRTECPGHNFDLDALRMRLRS